MGDIAARLKTSADATIKELEAKRKQYGTLSADDAARLEAARWQSDAWGEGGTARVLVFLLYRAFTSVKPVPTFPEALYGATQGVLAWLAATARWTPG